MKGTFVSERIFELPTHIMLAQSQTGKAVRAEFFRLHREEAKQLIDAVWWDSLDDTLSDPNEEPDREWEWREIVSVYQNDTKYRVVAVKTPDGAVQAALVYRFGFKSQLEPGKKGIYVDRLATAPSGNSTEES